MTQEDTVRATLPERPAAVLYAIPMNARNCFAGLFNGARWPGHVTPSGGLFVGKAECEWDWTETWAALRCAGLLEWREEVRPNHPKFGGSTTYIHWDITQKGHQVRRDDLAYFDALMNAMREDEKAA